MQNPPADSQDHYGTEGWQFIVTPTNRLNSTTASPKEGTRPSRLWPCRRSAAIRARLCEALEAAKIPIVRAFPATFYDTQPCVFHSLLIHFYRESWARCAYCSYRVLHWYSTFRELKDGVDDVSTRSLGSILYSTVPIRISRRLQCEGTNRVLLSNYALTV